MSQVSTYSNPAFSNPLRVLTIDETQWFVAMDVAKALGFANPSVATQRHCTKRKVLEKNQILDSRISSLFDGRAGRITIIPESDLFALVMRSDLPSAKRFQDWVTSEVLPSLKKTGSYSVPAVQQHQARNRRHHDPHRLRRPLLSQ